jgi:peptidoglycan/LPS O-acetylase OafA/YrhL
MWKRIGPHLDMDIFVPIGTLTSIGVSILTYHYVEKNIARFLRSSSGKAQIGGAEPGEDPSAAGSGRSVEPVPTMFLATQTAFHTSQSAVLIDRAHVGSD